MVAGPVHSFVKATQWCMKSEKSVFVKSPGSST